MMYKARLKVVTVYYKRQGNYCDIDMVKKMHLTTEQYKQSEVAWLSQHEDAWAWMCEYWASGDFLAMSNRNCENRLSNPGIHFFRADGHTRKAARMVCQIVWSIVNYTNLSRFSNLILQATRDGVEPSMIQVYVEGHKGPDPNSPEMLCDSGAMEKLVSMKIDPISNFNVFSLYIELDMLLYLTWIIYFAGSLHSECEGQNGPEANWLTGEFDMEAAYKAGRGVPHGRYAHL
jgi:hypothetical protein